MYRFVMSAWNALYASVFAFAAPARPFDADDCMN